MESLACHSRKLICCLPTGQNLLHHRLSDVDATLEKEIVLRYYLIFE
jgi:hypothetical protein